MTQAPEKVLPDRNQRADVGSPRLARAPFVVVMAAIAVGGCASVRQSVSGWFGETPPPEATAAPVRQGQTYYAAVEGLTVYAEASAASKVVGHG